MEKTRKEILEIIKTQWLKGVKGQNIAEHLNSLGYRPFKGKIFSQRHISKYLQRYEPDFFKKHRRRKPFKRIKNISPWYIEKEILEIIKTQWLKNIDVKTIADNLNELGYTTKTGIKYKGINVTDFLKQVDPVFFQEHRRRAKFTIKTQNQVKNMAVNLEVVKAPEPDQEKQKNLDNLVFENNGAVFTDSLTIADIFEKRHDNVLQAIYNLECSKEFNALNFQAVNYFDKKNQVRKKYLVTKNGFSFLVMGFTGPQAARFKELYINAFDKMEKTLKEKNNLVAEPKTNADMFLLVAQQFKNFENRLNNIEKNQAAAISALNNQEKSNLLPFNKSARAKINERINNYAIASGTDQKSLYIHLWNQFKYRYKIDILTRKHNIEKNGGNITGLEIADQQNLINEVWALCCQLFPNIELSERLNF